MFRNVSGTFVELEDLARALIEAGGPLPHEVKLLRKLGSGYWAQCAQARYGVEEELEEVVIAPRPHIFTTRGIRRRTGGRRP